MTLGEYLNRALSRRWEWGRWDCCCFAAGWVIERGHTDPMETVASYDSERSALLRISRGGGLVALWTKGMAHAGVPQTDRAEAGAVAVVEAEQHAGPAETVAIFTGRRWAMLGHAGLIMADPKPLAMWMPR